jgi:hypothetical protein
MHHQARIKNLRHKQDGEHRHHDAAAANAEQPRHETGESAEYHIHQQPEIHACPSTLGDPNGSQNGRAR